MKKLLFFITFLMAALVINAQSTNATFNNKQQSAVKASAAKPASKQAATPATPAAKTTAKSTATPAAKHTAKPSVKPAAKKK